MATIKRAGRWLLATLTALWLLRGTPATAQADVAVQALTIELWPEFDQPAVLVILRATLDPAVPLPAVVTLHLPAPVTGPSAVAAQDPSGQLLNTPYTVTAESEAMAVAVQTAYASFQVEYYDTRLAVTGEERAYRFAWLADFSVGAATLRVQEPAGARDLTTTPPVALAGASGLGLNYYTAALGALASGQLVTVDLRYAKSDAALSAGVLTPNAAPATSAAVRVAPMVAAAAPSLPFAPTAAAGLGLIVLALLGFGAGRRLRSQAAAREKLVAPPTPPTARPPVAAAAFCTQCGQPAVAGDRFCRQCGAPHR